MKAVTCQHSTLELTELPDPQPGRGQVVLTVLGCGICGSDLHARYHADSEADVLAEIGYDGFMRSAEPVVLGHEFAGEVADYGPGTRKKITPATPPWWRCHSPGAPAGRMRPGCRRRHRAAAPSRWWWKSRSCSPSRTAWRPSSRCSPSRWRSAGTRSAGPRSRRATSPS